MPKIQIFLILLFLDLPFLGLGQSDSVQIKEIRVQGNRHTKSQIITRELALQAGDWIARAEVENFCRKSRNLIFNTHLFNDVMVHSVPTDEGSIVLSIEVIEKWYIWPYPIIGFADRNFNIWWETQDINRLYAGASVQHYNFRGRAEKLKLRGLWGYTRLVEMDYEIPYLDKQKKHGLQAIAYYQSNKEVWLKTENNRLQFLFDPDQRAYKYVFGELAYLYRPKLFVRHRLGLFVEDILVSDTVLTEGANPRYLAGGRTNQTSIGIRYAFKWDKRDIAYYPLRGHFIEANVEPRYLVENRSAYLALRLNAELFHEFGKGFFGGIGARGKLSAPNEQPYALYQSLGYKYFVRGFEAYVVDGQHYGLIQSNVKYQLFNRNIQIPYVPFSQFKTAPTSVYLTAFADAGYVASTRFQEPGNTYQNTWLAGYGVGIDFATYYDRVIRIEYSCNGFGRKGLYLHFTAPI
ncbi:MAG: BamA/TamA family outer membrane protein [Bacteroidota bacterium]|nr:BamA/TamA family outer membrane protein [Bacteroidota bacterium]MDX5430410.1 BamA/TamA family outer membrane protein [Bacteroidota bacterium]MDX5469169.1 BamA/TamA family outer membrane protein [Bacteroidota bacterium]